MAHTQAMESSASASAPTSPAAPSVNTDSLNTDSNVPHGTDQEVSSESGERTPRPQAKQQKATAAQTDDDESAEIFGEKLTKKELAELRDTAKRRAEFDRAAHTRMQEAAAIRKANESERQEIVRLVNSLKENPFALHEKLGLNPDELAEQRLIAQMKRAQMSPEQIELEQLRSEKATRAKQDEETATKTKAEKAESLKQKYLQHFDKQIGDALTSANLARTRRTAAQVAGVMADYAAAGEKIEPRVAAQLVRDGYHTEIRHEVGELLKSNPRQAIDLLGPELIKQILAQESAKAKSFQPQAQSQKVSTITPPKPKIPDTFDDVRKKLGIKGF